MKKIVSIFTLVLILTAPAAAWQVVSAYDIPAGAVALTDGPGGLWCGYNIQGDSLLLVFNPENGEVVNEFNPPEANCYGLESFGVSVWFVGASQMYLLNARGDVTREVDIPYEHMRGLTSTDEGFWTMALDNGVFFLTQFEIEGEIDRFRTSLSHPADMMWDGAYLWVTDKVDGFLHRFDPQSGEEVDMEPTPIAGPTGIAMVGDSIALVDDGPGDQNDVLYIIDPAGEEAPRLLPISRHYDFGRVIIHSPAVQLLALFNVGGVNLEFTSIRLTGRDAGFRLGELPDRPVVTPGDHLLVRVTFDPLRYGPHSDTLIITSNDPGEPVTRTLLKGAGIYNSRRAGIYPQNIDFGVVRADPWRDGNSLREIAIFNTGLEDLRLDSLWHRITQIYHFEMPDFPIILQTAETLWVNCWFEPHRGIRYIDTLNVHSDGVIRIVTATMIGMGSDSIYAAGTVMWHHQVASVDGQVGGIVRIPDITADLFDDVAAVGGDGRVFCLSGFASDTADIVWTQIFNNLPFAPRNMVPGRTISASSDLDRDRYHDLLIGSGTPDGAVYGISGRSGALLWRWDSREICNSGEILQLLSGLDLNGDGAEDPVILLRNAQNDACWIIRLDGSTGRPVWSRQSNSARVVEALSDIDRDGVVDFVTVRHDVGFEIYSGAEGGLVRFIDAECSSPAIAAGDINGDAWIDLVARSGESGLAAWSIHDRDELWLVNTLGEYEMQGAVDFLLEYGADLDDDGINEIVGCCDSAMVFALNPVNGEVFWIEELNAISTMTVVSDNNDDGYPDVVAGSVDGRIDCIDGVDGTGLWVFTDENAGSVVQIINFEDIDLGGTADIVAVLSDGLVCCISSGGDLGYTPFEDTWQPRSQVLGSLYPNPFNGQVELRFTIPYGSHVKLKIIGVDGRIISGTDFEYLEAGSHTFSCNPFNNSILPNGYYLFNLETDAGITVYKGILLK